MPSPEPSPPNLLFILADDHGAWALGCAGNDEIVTPNLDQLAAEGIRFENFFCASPVCSPARATLLTGRMPSRHGVHDFLHWGEGVPADAIRFLDGQPTVPSIVRAAGYRTALCGKWHLGEGMEAQAGFDYWRAMPRGGSSYYRVPLAQEGKLENHEGVYATELYTNAALTFLETQRGQTQPFCLHVHYTAPHSPWDRKNHPSELWDCYYDDCPFDSTPAQAPSPDFLMNQPVSPEARREKLAGYYTAVELMDKEIGRLLDALEEQGIREQTLVVFMSDNGMNMGHRGLFGKGNATSPPNMFEESVKIPCIISQPGRIPSGRVERGLWSQYDWLPTLLDYTGLSDQTPAGLPGRSFASLLRGEVGGGSECEHVVVCDEYGPTRMLRSSEWKLIWRYPAGPHELYHLATDPGETRNLFHLRGHEETIERMRRELTGWFEQYASGGFDGRQLPITGKGQRDVADRPEAFDYRFPEAWLPEV